MSDPSHFMNINDGTGASPFQRFFQRFASGGYPLWALYWA
jgi:hypothetical protein